MQRSGAPGTARPSPPGWNTSLEITIAPSASRTSRTELTQRWWRPPVAVSSRWEMKTTKSMAPAMSRLVASTGNRSADLMA
jgi:hypothetical protein